MGKANSKSQLIRLGLGVLILIGVMLYVDLKSVLGYIKGANLFFLLSAIALYFCMYVLKAMRWREFLSSQDLDIRLRDALAYYLSSSFFGAFTPARVGEVTCLFGPARENRRYAESLACTAVDKGFDILLLLVLLLLASFSSILEARETYTLRAIGILGALASAVGIMRMFSLAKHDRGLPGRLIRLAPTAWRDTLTTQPREFFRASASSLQAKWPQGMIMSVLFWCAHVLCHYCLLLSLGATMDLWFFVLCLTLAGLVEFVPITICGLGTREVLLVFLFEKAALSADLAVAFGVMNVFLIYVITGLFAGLMQVRRD